MHHILVGVSRCNKKLGMHLITARISFSSSCSGPNVLQSLHHHQSFNTGDRNGLAVQPMPLRNIPQTRLYRERRSFGAKSQARRLPVAYFHPNPCTKALPSSSWALYVLPRPTSKSTGKPVAFQRPFNNLLFAFPPWVIILVWGSESCGPTVASNQAKSPRISGRRPDSSCFCIVSGVQPIWSLHLFLK